MITTTALRTRWQGQDLWLKDFAPRGGGKLLARILQHSVLFYFQYFYQGKRKTIALGAHDESGVRGLSLKQARERAGALTKRYREGVTDLHAYVEWELKAQDRARLEAEEATRRAKESSEQGTLRQLFIDGYVVGHLERHGKQSARDVRSVLTKHILKPYPQLAARRASEITVDDFILVLGKLVEAGKGRTAVKVRSYGAAAYQLAISSRTNPEAPLMLRHFGVTMNPFSSIDAMSRFNRARDRVLSAPEFAAFLRRLDSLPKGAQKDAVQLALLLGGQRPQQLLRLRSIEVDLSLGTITLYDGKGARRQPRRHVLPLVKEASAILERRLGETPAEVPLFSTDGRTQMRIETLTVLIRRISREMVKAKEAREAFQLRDLRRTCETMLAALGVSSDIRAQVQSHGLGGIQQRHYDRHDYALEKYQALQRWVHHLEALKEGKVAQVLPLWAGRSNRTPIEEERGSV
jgi:integrase